MQKTCEKTKQTEKNKQPTNSTWMDDETKTKPAKRNKGMTKLKRWLKMMRHQKIPLTVKAGTLWPGEKRIKRRKEKKEERSSKPNHRKHNGKSKPYHRTRTYNWSTDWQLSDNWTMTTKLPKHWLFKNSWAEKLRFNSKELKRITNHWDCCLSQERWYHLCSF